MRFVICEFVNAAASVCIVACAPNPLIFSCAEGDNALFSGWQLCICMSMNADMDRRGDSLCRPRLCLVPDEGSGANADWPPPPERM
ncbi:hypothetical protein BDP81DRAFT_423692, partial [Colletotrichum phormii]